VLIGLSLLALAGLMFTGVASEQPEVAYQNEEYQVPPPDQSPPPLPVPQTYEEAVGYITRNPFYNQTAPLPVRCDSRPINVATASDDELDEHFEGLMECLVRFWEPPVTSAGFIIVRPTVTIYGSEITTKCGEAGVNAFYCTADQQIYFSNRLADGLTVVRRENWAADVVMAHEFGHALQARTAILVSSNALGANSNDKSIELELSRRTETQADCFSGMFVRGVSESLGVQQSDLEGIQETYVAVGDDVLSGRPNIVGNHGRGKSRRYWGMVGLGTSDVSDCNTYVADQDQVR
jgi:predicted metalloprotease